MKKFAFYVSNKGTRLKKFLQIYKNFNLIKQIKFVLIDKFNLSNLTKSASVCVVETDNQANFHECYQRIEAE